MTKIREDRWQHGSIDYRGRTVEVQRVGEGEWFARIAEPGWHLLILVGPCASQRDAERSLVDGIQALWEREL